MKKKLLFVHPNMNFGGVESALLAALRMLSPEKYDITLMLDRLGGPTFDEIPNYINVGEIPMTPIGDYRRRNGWNATVKYALKSGCVWYAIRMIALKLWWILIYRWRGVNFGDLEAFQLNDDVDVSRLPGGIDFAFAYFGGIHNGDFVSRYFNNSTTAIWFHNGGTRFRYRRYREVTCRFDHVFACSKSLAELFNRTLSRGDIHWKVMPHYIDFESYRKQAENGEGLPEPKHGRLRLLTVARLDRQKGIDIAIEAAKVLVGKELDFVWYIIGGGAPEEEYKRLTNVKQVGDRFVFLGARKNPFPAYKDCDIYVQPSRLEAYCLTLAEARAFDKPIVTTDFVGANEQIVNEETGLIVLAENVASLVEGIERLIKDEALRTRLSNNLAVRKSCQTQEAVEAWEKLLKSH